MAILLEPEFYSLQRELEKIKSLIGVMDKDILLDRVDKILERLDKSKQARIKKAKLRLLK